jgi:hypothetical protein
MRQLVWPREHGAWGIVGVPLTTGAAVGAFQDLHLWSVLLLSVAAFALFCLRTPVESLFGNAPLRAQNHAERSAVTRFIFLYSAVAVLALAWLLWHGRNRALLPLGIIAGVLFAIQSAVRGLGRRARTASQLIGALGLTSAAAGAYYVATGHMDLRAGVLWVLNWALAANQIQFVQIRLHGAKLQSLEAKLAAGWRFLCAQTLMLVALAVLWGKGVVPGLVLLAFAPIVVRGTIWFFRKSRPLQVHRLGLSELAHAVVFGALLIVAFAL